MEKAKVPEERFERLRSEIADYEEIKGSILTGIEDYEKIEYQKKKILKFLNATEKEYDDYHWQIRNRFTTAESISKIIGLSENDLKYINEVATRYRFAVSPYYLSLT
ncbi:MAG: lysine 2,3-aminomutase, partial [Clostridiaceae bacterium]|nr:lysine 2,3-aminomutase [Clostridiaceae bacterium]